MKAGNRQQMGNPGGAEQLLLIRGCLGGFPEENGLQHPRILRVCRTRNAFVQGAPQGPEPAGPNQRNSLRRLCPGFPQPEADAPGAVIRPAVKAARIGGAGKKSERSGQPHRGSDPVLRNVLCLPDHAPRRVPDAVRRHRGAPQGHRPARAVLLNVRNSAGNLRGHLFARFPRKSGLQRIGALRSGIEDAPRRSKSTEYRRRPEEAPACPPVLSRIFFLPLPEDFLSYQPLRARRRAADKKQHAEHRDRPAAQTSRQKLTGHKAERRAKQRPSDRRSPSAPVNH